MGNLLINQGTNAAINFDLSGTVNTQVVGIGYGTVSTLGTLPNLPGGSIVVTTLPNLPQGSINVTAGTIATLGTMGTLGTVQGLGTLPGVGVVTSLTNGSIVVTAGTVVNNGGSAIAYGPAAAAAAATGNPLNIGGTDSGGTIRSMFVDTQGHLRVDMPTGTISVLPNLPQGSINVTAGTIGTVTNIGTLNQVISGTSATSLGKAGSTTTYATGDTGVAAFGIRNENFTTQAGTEGQYIPLQLDRFGRLYIQGDVLHGTMQLLGTLQAGTVTLANVAGLLPANAALADGFANPTTSHIGAEVMTWDGGNWNRTFAYAPGDAGANDRGVLTNSRLQGWNGTAWDRLQVDASKNLKTTATVSVQVGTINVGTINTGTLSPIPTIAISTFGTHGTTGVSIFGTLAGGTGAGAGTEIFITSLSLSIPSTAGSQDVSIGWGSNAGTFHAGTGLLVRGNFPAGGGIQKQFYPPVNSGTNGQLMYFQAGAGTVDISATYFITASTI